MTTNISINSFSLKNFTYQSFISQFKKFPTQNEARFKGYEAHHIIPISSQLRIYNKIHNTTLNRSQFEKTEECDDSCVRLTHLDHIIAHYLWASEGDEEDILAFDAMFRVNYYKLPEEEKLLLEKLEEIALLREKAFENESLLLKGLNKGKSMKERTGNPEWESPLKGENNPAYGKKWFTDGSKNIYLKEGDDPPEGFFKGYTKTYVTPRGKDSPFYGKKASLETRRKLSESHKGQTLSDEERAHLSEVLKGKPHPWNYESAKIRKEKGYHHTEEAKKKMSLKNELQKTWAKEYHLLKDSGQLNLSWNEFKTYKANQRNKE